jgi:hypothetical protein
MLLFTHSAGLDTLAFAKANARFPQNASRVALTKLIPDVGPRVSPGLLISKWPHPMTWGDDFAPLPGIPHILLICGPTLLDRRGDRRPARA